ncbi:MAG TPA: hypothetical protein VID70_03235, partial [Solirubrobacteraceae bacterium]
AAATAVVRADLEMIHAAVLSRYTGDIDRRLAIDYANIASTGEQQIATRLTNLWLAVALLLTGAIMTLGAWLWADASRSAAQQPSCPCVYTYKKNHHKEPDQGKWQRKHGQGDSKDRRDHWKHHQEHEKHVHIKVHCHEHGQHMHDRRHGQSQMIKPHENSENEMAHPKTIRQELPFTR